MDNPEALEDFNKWVDDHAVVRSWEAIQKSGSYEEILAVRMLIGELQGMRDFINAPLLEAQAIKERENGGDVEQLEEYLTRNGYYATGYRSTFE